MDGYRDLPEDPRRQWAGGDADWPSYPPPPADGVRPPDEGNGYGEGRYTDVEIRPAPEHTFPGFEPRRSPADGAPSVPGGPPAAPPAGLGTTGPPGAGVGGPPGYPIITPPLGDPTATAERLRTVDAPTGPVAAVPQRSGPPPAEDFARFHAEPLDRVAPRRSAGPAAPVSDGVYRTRRPGLAVLLALGAVALAVPALRLFVDGAFGGPVVASSMVSGMLLLAGLPAFAMGLYALMTGAARVPDQRVEAAWLRTPLAYLPVGLVLLVAAAIAAG